MYYIWSINSIATIWFRKKEFNEPKISILIVLLTTNYIFTRTHFCTRLFYFLTANVLFDLFPVKFLPYSDVYYTLHTGDGQKPKLYCASK